MTNVPKIRFPGFTEPWEQRKLGDECNQLTTVINPQNEPNRLFAEYSMPAYDLNKNPDYVLGSTMNSARKVIERPCLLINKLNVRKQRIWCIEDPEKNAVCSAEFIPVCSEGIDLRFLSYVVSGNAFTSYLENCSSGSSNSQKRVTPDTIMNAEICIPSRAEQQKIGDYFRNLDHFITLHQYKLDDLKEMKRGLLQKMFPAQGSNVPEIRFPGFTEPWEQRKLGDEAIEMLAGGDIDKSRVVENGKYPIYANALTNDGIVGYYDDYYRVKAPAVTVTGRGDVGHAQARTVDFTPVVRLLAIRSEHDAYFLENAINNHGVIVESTGVPQLTVPQLGNYMIQFPRTIEEETKIGDYFRNLDNLITLHQRKLDDLKELKKGLLQQMFVE